MAVGVACDYESCAERVADLVAKIEFAVAALDEIEEYGFTQARARRIKEVLVGNEVPILRGR